MANVTINNKTYNGITKVLLPLADGNGTAEFSENSGEEVTGSLYPLQSGRSATANLSVEVSGNHHVDGQVIGGGISGQVISIGLWAGLPNARSNPATYEWFTIPSGANVSFKMENLSKNGITGIAFGVAKPAQSASIDNRPIGVDGGQISGTTTEYSFVASEDIPVSSVYVVFVGGAIGADFSFDVNVTVNGTRWI